MKAEAKICCIGMVTIIKGNKWAFRRPLEKVIIQQPVMHLKQNDSKIGTDRQTDRHKNLQEKQPYKQEEKISHPLLNIIR
jgi:hypothetical protein